MLRMNHLSKVYRTEVVETHALRDFSVHVREGEFVAVTGPSGSGKTTFLTIAGLLEEFTSGEYLLDGIDVRGMNDTRRSRLRNEKLGFIFQAFNLMPELTVAANVEVPLRYRRMPAAERRKRVADSLARVGLSARAKHYPSELADEPTGNLDSQMARGVMELLEELHREGATIVMVTHDPELAARAQREVHIVDGRVVELVEPHRMGTPPRAGVASLQMS
jgi:putative ABC transport system ATP-binding protein